MPTLVLPPRFTPDSTALWKAAIDAGWDIERLQGWRVPSNFANEDVVLYGEPLFAAIVADQLHLAMLEPHFQWLAELSPNYRQREVVFSTLAHARQQTVLRFIKPADDKCFQARVYESGSELPSGDIVDDETPVLIAEPVKWQVEYRCFVMNRKITTFSVYLRNNQLARADDGSWVAPDDEQSEAVEYANSVLADASVRLPPGVVLDVGRIAGRGWAVVETNAAWGSGIYGCDPNAVLGVIQRACIKKDRLTEEDKCWMVKR